ncbi:hypothetical protein ACFPLB_04085 [Aquamicrobium segne]|uniref:RecT family protein n=1 Tax=Aquamicrobium segne TaxID=469547 RepID=A0ABW0GZH0_9HYPH
MNQIATRPGPDTSINSISVSNGIGGASIAPQNLGEVVRFAEVMCKADIALPKHLRGNAGACMAVALQALEWQMSPFAVASKSYAVNGAIAYEAQLIMAVINTRSGIEGRLKFRFEGEGPERVCIAYGKIDGEELDVRSPKFKDITPKNSPLWKSDPDQQQCYYTARAWGRRHTPEVILGVYDRDEVEQFRGSETARDVTPSLQERLKLARIEQHNAAQPQEGFDPNFTTSQSVTVNGETDGNQTQEITQSAAPSPADGGEDAITSSVGDLAATNQTDEDANSTEENVASNQTVAASAKTPSDPLKRMLCEELIDNMLRAAFSEPAIERPENLDKIRDAFLLPQNLGDHPDFIRLCHETARRIIGNASERERAHKFLTGKIPVGKDGA